jgi:hypothetical protein
VRRDLLDAYPRLVIIHRENGLDEAGAAARGGRDAVSFCVVRL